ncbi:MAG: RES family NAD+ phosphorylase [Acidobacteriaceae bacterium]|nr:RES family NAD+ phosphorylase [Acidobacteriaceae bacterium]MBV9781923.1 RES family NAD+ phosphorylase [Acidobacteriaceae bacterium]
MILWRISRHRDLGGTGGLRSPGRWHHAGQPIVYLAESAAGALLEVCVHTSANDVPPDFTLLKIEAPEVQVQAIKCDGLPAGWQSQLELTRDLGTAWLQKKDTALLRVPSAIVPETVNFLLNPTHPDAKKFRIVEALLYPFDVRLKK